MSIKKLLPITILLLIMKPCFGQDNIYVSSQGDDAGNGSKKYPYNSITKALNSSEALKTSSRHLTINIGPGTYYISRAINISRRYNRPIVIKGDDKSMPIISGGTIIKGWEKYKKNIYKTYLPDVINGKIKFEQLYVNDKRAQPARTPNVGFIPIKNIYNSESGDKILQLEKSSSNKFNKIGKLSNSELKEMRLQLFQKWDVMTWRPSVALFSEGKIGFNKWNMKPLNPIQEGSLCVIYNCMNALDSTQEWFLDSSRGNLYYIPENGVDINKSKVIAATNNKLLTIKGTSDVPVSNLAFENIIFEYASYITPEDGEGPEQSAANIEGAIELDFTKNITFNNCVIKHTGGYGICLGEKCYSDTIKHCLFTDIGAGGIKVGKTDWNVNCVVSSNNVFDNNIIKRLGRNITCGAGILVLNATDNKITHNDISDLYYSGISVGWTWGYNDNSKYNHSVHNIISYNKIHTVGQGMLSDLGGIYTLGEQPGTIIENNIIYDVIPYYYDGIGIYADEGSSFLTIKNNLVYNCTHGAFQLNYGKDNIVENNIFAFCKLHILQHDRVEAHKELSVKHNIILQNNENIVNNSKIWFDGDIDVDNNLYWNTNGSLNFASRTFDEWKKVKDKDAVQADPLFKDAANYNFTFTSTRNADRINFKPFDYSKAGVYGSVGWKLKAEL